MLGEESWLTAMIAAKGTDPCNEGTHYFSEHFCYYTLSLYWASQTLTTVGYGDMTPQNHLEYLINLVCMMLASAVWTWLLADIVALLEIVSHEDKKHRLETDSLNDFVVRRRLP